MLTPHVIIGTAGHIDHGKTTLIRALTGRSTDRLQEEIRRGISIDLGFTYFDLPSGNRAGIIDVPGHERFIKNMIAGAGGIDIVLLTVDTTEGIKPQTLEHADIVSFLGIKEGLIVMTKYDAADDIMRELAADDIRDQLSGTFFKDKEIIPVDSISGYGLDNLIKKIDELALKTKPRKTDAPVRLPIDRVFTVKGFGTVVTGTLIEGTIRENETLSVHSCQTDKIIPVKVKHIQIHDTDTQIAYAGQRTAINLAGGMKAADLTRGDILAQEGSMVHTALTDAQITLTPRAPATLKMWDRLRVHMGAREVFARLVPFGEDENETITPGETAFCQLRFEQALYVKKGDLFVIRRYSPSETLGGGVVIDPAPVKRRHTDAIALKDLAARMEGTSAEIVERCLRNAGKPTDLATLSALSAYTDNQTADILAALIIERAVFQINQYYLHAELLDAYRDKLLSATARFHQDNPLLPGIAKETLRTKTALPLSPRAYDGVIELLAGDGSLWLPGNGIVAVSGFTPRYTEQQRRIRDMIEQKYLDAGFMPPPKSQFAADKTTRTVFDTLAKQILVALDDDTFLHVRHLNTAKEMIRAHCLQHRTVTLAEFRDMTKSSRKYCLLILDYLDDHRFTKRDGDSRVLY